MRKPTPNIMDELMPAKSETTELRAGLKWDYSQLGEAASEVMGHAIEIKRVEKRASEAIVEAGRHLIAVKQSLSHGQWEDWLQTEFAMSDRTARRMMAVAEQFDGKTDTVSVLGPSVLYLLAGDSVPEPAREAVIDLAKSGETVTKAQAQAVINQHKPSRPTPGERYLAGLPALNMTTPTATPAGTYSTPLGNLPKNPIEDWELEDIVEQAATEYYGSVTAAQGEEMAQQSRAHAGEYWAKLQRVLAPFDVSVERVEAAVAATVERLVGERRALRPGSPEAKALTKEIKSATWGDQLLKQPQRYAEVWELERLLAQWAQSLDASVLRSTARLRGGAQWWEARKALQALTSLNYRDRDLVSALHNLANQKDAQAAAETITDPVKGIVVDGDQPLPGWVDADAKQRTIDAAKRIAEAAPVSQREGYDSDEWYTPGWVIEAATAVMGQIDLDPASCELAQETVQAGLYWTKRQDGCRVGWFGRVWLNPPYSAPGAFVDKLIEEYTAGNVKQACVLLNNATETRWFQRLLARFPVCFFSQRLAFWRHDHEDVGARQGQALFYLGPDVEKFVEVFGEHGIVVKRLD